MSKINKQNNCIGNNHKLEIKEERKDENIPRHPAKISTANNTDYSCTFMTPRLICRRVAASYCGISPNSFDRMVADKTFPPPIKLGNRRVWDIKALDKSVDQLSEIRASFDLIMEQINAVH